MYNIINNMKDNSKHRSPNEKKKKRNKMIRQQFFFFFYCNYSKRTRWTNLISN